MDWVDFMQARGKFEVSSREKIIMKTILLSDMQPLHLVKNTVVQLASGNSSGGVFTTAKNCFTNACYVLASYLENVPPSTNTRFQDNVAMVTFGDDLAFSVHPEVAPYFNDEIHAKTMAKYGIKVTTANKNGDFGPKPITEIQFLKCKFGKQFGTYVPLQQDPMEQTNWIRDGNNSPDFNCEQNCNAALFAGFWYGPIYFNENRNKMRRMKPNYKLIDYDTMNDEFHCFGFVRDTRNVFGFTQHVPKKLEIKQLLNTVNEDDEDVFRNLKMEKETCKHCTGIKNKAEEALCEPFVCYAKVIHFDGQYWTPGQEMELNKIEINIDDDVGAYLIAYDASGYRVKHQMLIKGPRDLKLPTHSQSGIWNHAFLVFMDGKEKYGCFKFRTSFLYTLRDTLPPRLINTIWNEFRQVSDLLHPDGEVECIFDHIYCRTRKFNENREMPNRLRHTSVRLYNSDKKLIHQVFQNNGDLS